MQRRTVPVLLIATIMAACGSDSTGPGPIGSDGPDTLAVIGHGAVLTRFTAELAVRGDWAYTTTWGNRTGAPGNAVFIWNVAGSIPLLTDSLIVSDASTLGDVQISDDGALLVVAREYDGAIVLYDRTDPAQPQWRATFTSANTANGVHTVKLGRVDGRHYAFLAVNPGQGGARLVIVDITDPDAPAEVMARVMGRPYVHDTYVRDGILFTALWDDGVGIWDIGGGGRGGSVADPVLISTLAPASGNIHNIWWFHDPTGAKRYLFLGEEGPGSVGTLSSGDIHVIDIDDITQPRQVARYSVAGAGTHNFSMDEESGVLYAAYYNGGVRALDVTGDLEACSAAQRLADGLCSLRSMGREKAVALTAGHYIWGVAYQDGTVYASDMTSGIYRLDASGLRR
jgi:hypothetical protein